VCASAAGCQVRDVAKVGGQNGQTGAFPADHSENIRRSPVRSQCQLALKSSKRVQTRETLGGTEDTVCRDKIRAVEQLAQSGVYEIRAQWDGEAGVWVAESDDVPGLVAEADSPKILVQKLRTLIPELLELNGAVHDRTASFHVLYQHEDSGVLTF